MSTICHIYSVQAIFKPHLCKLSHVSTATWILFHRANNQLSRHEPEGEGTVCGVVYGNKVGYTDPKTFQWNIPQGAPSRPSIRAWHKEFRETGSVSHKKDAGRSVVSDENVESIYFVFVRSALRNACKSILAAAHELQMLHSTVHWVLTKMFASVCLQVASGARNYAINLQWPYLNMALQSFCWTLAAFTVS
jgi:hypothetical protein